MDVNLEELKLGRGSGLGVRADVYGKKSRWSGQAGSGQGIRVDVYEE